MNYAGGLTEVFKYVVDEPVFDVDVNSMYPWAMTLPLPWSYSGYREVVDGVREVDEILSGRRETSFYHVQYAEMQWVHTSPTHSKYGALYPRRIRNTWLWGTEIRACRPRVIRLIQVHDYLPEYPDRHAEVTAAR